MLSFRRKNTLYKYVAPHTVIFDNVEYPLSYNKDQQVQENLIVRTFTDFIGDELLTHRKLYKDQLAAAEQYAFVSRLAHLNLFSLVNIGATMPNVLDSIYHDDANGMHKTRFDLMLMFLQQNLDIDYTSMLKGKLLHYLFSIKYPLSQQPDQEALLRGWARLFTKYNWLHYLPAYQMCYKEFTRKGNPSRPHIGQPGSLEPTVMKPPKRP